MGVGGGLIFNRAPALHGSADSGWAGVCIGRICFQKGGAAVIYFLAHLKSCWFFEPGIAAPTIFQE
jgi:hypothetical protein